MREIQLQVTCLGLNSKTFLTTHAQGSLHNSSMVLSQQSAYDAFIVFSYSLDNDRWNNFTSYYWF